MVNVVVPGEQRGDPTPRRQWANAAMVEVTNCNETYQVMHEFEADELWARLIQHEFDHLHGVLMFDRMTPDQRKEALTEYRRMQEAPAKAAPHRVRLK